MVVFFFFSSWIRDSMKINYIFHGCNFFPWIWIFYCEEIPWIPRQNGMEIELIYHDYFFFMDSNFARFYGAQLVVEFVLWISKWNSETRPKRSHSSIPKTVYKDSPITKHGWAWQVTNHDNNRRLQIRWKKKCSKQQIKSILPIFDLNPTLTESLTLFRYAASRGCN